MPLCERTPTVTPPTRSLKTGPAPAKARYIDPMTTVVAGILRHEGRILICRRRADQPHPLKWEFPGGKLEPGESPAAALARELHEELGIDSTVGKEIARYEFAYRGKQPILLIFLEVTSWKGELENRIFDAIVWERSQALQTHDFLEGDLNFLATLAETG